MCSRPDPDDAGDLTKSVRPDFWFINWHPEITPLPHLKHIIFHLVMVQKCEKYNLNWRASLVLCATAVWVCGCVWELMCTSLKISDQINHIWTFTAKKKKKKLRRKEDMTYQVIFFHDYFLLLLNDSVNLYPPSQFTDSLWIGSVLHLSGVRLFDGHQREKPLSKGDCARRSAAGWLCYVFRKLPSTSHWWTLWCPVWLSVFPHS